MVGVLALDPQIDVLDGIVLALYAAAMLLVGAYFAKRTRSAEDYHLGGRGMKSWTVGLSLFASLLSAISYLAHPEEMMKHGPMFIAGYAAYPFIVLVVGWIIIPALMRSEVSTAYELLGRRFGPTVRTFGSLIFISLRFIWMAFIVFLLATKIIIPVLGLDAETGTATALWVSAAVGLVTVVYTALGGLRAVVVTDVAQTFILFGGAVFAVVVVHLDQGGFASWWPSEWSTNWDPPRFFYNDESPEARTFFWTGLSVFTWYVCTAGSDQVAIQRYLATNDARAARRAFITSLSADVIVTTFLGVLGLALLAYFRAHPEALPAGETLEDTGENLFLRFILHGLPTGVVGLVIASLLAAAMSSLSSGVNSVGSVLAADFSGVFGVPTEAGEETKVRRARALSWGVGVLVVLLSLVVGQVDQDGSLLEKAYKTVNLLVAPLFVLFFLALFVKRATSLGAMVGASVAIGVAVWIAAADLIFWMMPGSFAAGVITGVFCSLFDRRIRAES